MSDSAKHAMHGLLAIGGFDNSYMTSGARPSHNRGYAGTPTFQIGDITGIVGLREGQIACEGYFKVGDLGQVNAILDRAIAEAQYSGENINLFYAPYGPRGAASIGEDCLLAKVHQILINEGGNVNGVVMLNQTYIANGGFRKGKVLHVHSGAAPVTGYESQVISFNAAPTVQEFALLATGGSDRFVFTPATSNAALEAGIEGLAAYNGLNVTITGSLTGTTTKSGDLTVVFEGAEDVPLLIVKSSESQRFQVAGGNTGNYTINGGANFTLGISEGSLQTNVRATSWDDALLVKGSSTALTGGNANTVVSGTGGDGYDGSYVPAAAPAAANPAYPAYDGPSTSWIYRTMADDIRGAPYQDVWILSNGGTTGATVIYYSTTDSPDVPSTGWMLGAGSNVPTVTPPTPGTGGVADFTIYLPYTSGNIANGVVTGTGATMTNVTQGSTVSTVITVATAQEGGLDAATYTLRSASFNGTAVDLGAARSRGAVAHLHVIYANGAGKTATVRIQQSADGLSGWTTLLTFDAMTNTGSNRKTLADGTSVQRYVRAAITSGQITGTFAFDVGISPFA